MYSLRIFGKELLSFGRATISAPSDLTAKNMTALFSGISTDAGVNVNEESSLGFSAVYSAVRVISEAIATLPLQVYTKTEEGREMNSDHPLYYILHDQPNIYQTSYTYRETLSAHQCLWGNAYSFIERDGASRVVGLHPIHPSLVVPKFDDTKKKIFYVINNKEVIEQSNILHFPALSMDGIIGKSPIQVAKESIGLGMAAEKFGASFYGNGANMTGILKHPGKLTESSQNRLRNSWNKHEGIGKAHGTAILEEGMTYERISIPPEQAQFLGTRKFQISEIARWFKLPPHLLGDMERTTFSNIESQDIAFIKYSLAPWLKRWEQELNKKLLTNAEKGNTYFEFNVEGFLRGDIKTRSEFYSKMITSRVLSPNEVRRMENLRDYDGGDSYDNPNTTPGGQRKK